MTVAGKINRGRICIRSSYKHWRHIFLEKTNTPVDPMAFNFPGTPSAVICGPRTFSTLALEDSRSVLWLGCGDWRGVCECRTCHRPSSLQFAAQRGEICSGKQTVFERCFSTVIDLIISGAPDKLLKNSLPCKTVYKLLQLCSDPARHF